MSKLSELTDVLDDGVRMLKRRADLLDRICACVQERKVEELEDIVNNSPAFEDRESELMHRIQRNCRSVANSRDIEAERYTLSMLLDHLEGREAVVLRDLRERLVFAIHEVQKKARCVAEMAGRVRQVEERMLLAALGEQEDDTETYGSDGQVARNQQGVALQHQA